MGGLADGTKEAYEQSTGCNEEGSEGRVDGEWLMQEEGSAKGVEDESGGLECTEDGQRKSGDLDGATDDVRDEEKEHANLRLELVSHRR